MKLHASSRARAAALGLVFGVLAAGCGGSGGGLPAGGPAGPSPLVFGAFPSAAAVVGQTGFGPAAPDGTPGTLTLPRGEPAVAADGRLFVADEGTNTLKVFGRYDQHGPTVDFPGVVAPVSVSIQSGRLVVIDGDTVRIFESAAPGAAEIATAGGAALCNASGLRSPGSAHLTPNGRLVVADSGNHRVLIWNQVTSPLGDPHVVIGQQNLTSCEANGGAASPSDRTLRAPASVWSDGNRLIVADRSNHRVLVWDSFPATNFQPATTVLGQRGFADAQQNAGGLSFPSAMSLDQPVSVDVSEAGQLAVVDQQNNRVLLWNRLPAAGAHGQPADQVLGKAGFTEGEANPPTDKTLAEPSGVLFHGSDLLVVDSENHRVLVWRGTPVPVAPPPGAIPSQPVSQEPPELPGPGNGAY